MGLAVGPWLRVFKDAILGEPDESSMEVTRPNPSEQVQRVPLGSLKKEIMQITSGRKIAYVVNCAFTEANLAKIVPLAQDAHILFMEATFLEADAARATAYRHLTARQAGTIARLANVKRVPERHLLIGCGPRAAPAALR